MLNKALIAVVCFGMVGCAGMKIPDYAKIKESPYYDECREFAADVYKNNGYSKLANTVILNMNAHKAQLMVSGCVIAMGKTSYDEIKDDLNKKGISIGMVSGACYDVACKVDAEQKLKAYSLGSYYASTKKFPNKMKVEF